MQFPVSLRSRPNQLFTLLVSVASSGLANWSRHWNTAMHGLHIQARLMLSLFFFANFTAYFKCHNLQLSQSAQLSPCLASFWLTAAVWRRGIRSPFSRPC